MKKNPETNILIFERGIESGGHKKIYITEDDTVLFYRDCRT